MKSETYAEVIARHEGEWLETEPMLVRIQKERWERELAEVLNRESK